MNKEGIFISVEILSFLENKFLVAIKGRVIWIFFNVGNNL